LRWNSVEDFEITHQKHSGEFTLRAMPHLSLRPELIFFRNGTYSLAIRTLIDFRRVARFQTCSPQGFGEGRARETFEAVAHLPPNRDPTAR